MARAQTIDDVLNTYGPPIEDAHLLGTFWEIRNIIRCNHLNRTCMIRGRCCIQFAEETLERLALEKNVREFRQVIDAMRRRLSRRHEVWAALCNYDMSDEEGYVLENSAMDILHTYMTQPYVGRMLSKHTRRAEQGYCYVDDSFCFLHAFMIPVGADVEVSADALDVGFYVIRFYDVRGDQFEFENPYVVGGRGPDRGFLNEYNAAHPECSVSGGRIRRRHVVYLPRRLQNAVQDHVDRVALMRRLDVETKLITNRRVALGKRIMRQRIGYDVHSFDMFVGVLRHCRGEDLFKLAAQYGGTALSSFALPMPVVRRQLHFPDESIRLADYFGQNCHCAGCYLGERYGVYIDLRTADYTGGVAVRRCVPVAHGAEYGGVERIQGMPFRTTYVRQGEHWYAADTYSCYDELLQAAGVIHRYFRGGCIGTMLAKRQMVSLIAHAYTHWDPTPDDTILAFRLVAYLYSGYFIASVEETTAWTELGEFLEVMMHPDNVGPHELMLYHRMVMQMCIVCVSARNVRYDMQAVHDIGVRLGHYLALAPDDHEDEGYDAEIF